jgi:DNA-binding NarL/FixJ family response regulator
LTMCKCDAVLLDYDMPATDGYEVAFEIKRVIPGLVVIMLSGSEVPLEALALADGFIPKLEASRQLLPMIAELCAHSHDTWQKQDHFNAQVGNSLPGPPPAASLSTVYPAGNHHTSERRIPDCKTRDG